LYEECFPLSLGYDTTTPIQPEGLERQKDFFEAERTQYTERTDKTIKFQKETCETGQAANQWGQQCQSSSANDALLHRDPQASNGLVEDWTNEGELVTSQKSPSGLFGPSSLTTGEPVGYPGPFGPVKRSHKLL
jgi:hypothetical protein